MERQMNFKNPVTGEQFALPEREAAFLEGAMARFSGNTPWGSFENFAFGPASPIYARRRSFRRLVRDPLYRALQDMWLQLGVNQGEVKDDRAAGVKGFCQEEEKDEARAGQGRPRHTAFR
jgi:hypothetical protein